jgi:hypothetical protein
VSFDEFTMEHTQGALSGTKVFGTAFLGVSAMEKVVNIWNVKTSTIDVTAAPPTRSQRHALSAGWAMYVILSVFTVGAWALIALIIRQCITRSVNSKLPDGSNTDTPMTYLQFIESDRFKQLKEKVDKFFPEKGDRKVSHSGVKVWLRDIFLSYYPRSVNLFLSIDEDFLKKMCALVDQDRLVDVLMQPAPGTDVPIIYPALCELSQYWDRSDLSCSRMAFRLLVCVGTEGRKHLFEQRPNISQGDKRNVKEIIIDNFSQTHQKKENCIAFIDDLLGMGAYLEKDEYEELLMAKGSDGQTIVDHMKKTKDEKLIGVYNELIERRNLGDEFRLHD